MNIHYRNVQRYFVSLFSVSWLVFVSCGGDEHAQSSEPPATTAADSAQHTNRLAQETSPYLLMHAHNPVDWYPWGDEALAKAKRENKPIFLSIGYSSCHWCHVMERESFLDPEIARVLNDHFVCIKVDREERPDVDAIYMTSLQIFNQLTGSGRGGGWPLSMFLTPDAEPFFGGTYFPARDGDRGAATGFLTLIKKVQDVWQQNPNAIRDDAKTITRFTKTELEGQSPAEPLSLDEKLLAATQQALADQYDETYGGFGFDPHDPARPKFPEPSNLFFLLERARNDNDQHAREMLIGTLQHLATGGIRDHLGGGFHRYSVDRFWRIPHFEKMLYDNGQLASVYSEAYLLTGQDEFRRTARQLAEFVLREMTTGDGAFYSALDADSEGEEGKYYRWTKAEVRQVLGDDQYELFAAVYGLDRPPNFEGEFYVPQLAKPLEEIAADRKLTAAALEASLQPLREKLLVVRSKRIRPLTDTKVLTSWNGLMIRGLADAGRCLKEERYVCAAERAADFALTKLRTDDGRLQRTYAGGEAKLNAYVNDYAFLVDGLLALYRATRAEKWLKAADELTAQQIELFWDEKQGGFFFTSDDHESLLARAKDPSDGAEPAGNSVSAENLVFLARELDRPDYLEKARLTLQSISGLLNRAPAAAPRAMVAVSQLLAADNASHSPDR